ncbi:hypothetical protein AAMO2058_000380100 [Amorphochlora amoebiformis]
MIYRDCLIRYIPVTRGDITPYSIKIVCTCRILLSYPILSYPIIFPIAAHGYSYPILSYQIPYCCTCRIFLFYPLPYSPILSYPILSYHLFSYPILSYHRLSCPIPSYPILSYPILSYPILSYPILSYPILSYHILSYPILSYPILSYPILSYPILSYPILSYPILSYPTLSYPILSYPVLSYILFNMTGYVRKRRGYHTTGGWDTTPPPPVDPPLMDRWCKIRDITAGIKIPYRLALGLNWDNLDRIGLLKLASQMGLTTFIGGISCKIEKRSDCICWKIKKRTDCICWKIKRTESGYPMVTRQVATWGTWRQVDRLTRKVSGMVSKLKIPILYIHGLRDVISNPKGSHYWHQQVPGRLREIMILKNGWHNSLLEPEAQHVLDKVKTWIQRDLEWNLLESSLD